jgi:acetyl-CoA synthetase (ADP-forming)
VEGTRDGPEIVEALKFAANRKPVAVLKGGMTAGGMKAVSSHTGAMAGSSEIWEAAARQAKAPMVPSMDELVDAAQAYVYLKKPAGPRIGLITISGGFGVFATDILSKAGFEIPTFSAKTSEELTRLIKRPGTSVRNPVDMAATFFQLKKYPQLFTSLDSDPNIDLFVVLLAIEYTTYMEEEFLLWANIFADHLINAFKLMKKPLAVVFFQTTLNEKRIEIERRFIEAGFPVFPTVERCANALLRRMICAA